MCCGPRGLRKTEGKKGGGEERGLCIFCRKGQKASEKGQDPKKKGKKVSGPGQE
jgi:hypothetical protein